MSSLPDPRTEEKEEYVFFICFAFLHSLTLSSLARTKGPLSVAAAVTHHQACELNDERLHHGHAPAGVEREFLKAMDDG